MILKKLGRLVHPSWAVVGFCIGVVGGDILALVWQVDWLVGWVWLVLGVMLLLVAILVPRRLTLVLVILGGMIVIGWRVSGDLIGKEVLAQYHGVDIEITGIVAKDPETDESSTSYSVNQLKLGGELEVVGKIYITGRINREIKRGDGVRLAGKLSEGFGTFAGAMYRPTLRKITRAESDLLLEARDSLAGQVRRFIPEPEAALGLGYLLGIKSGLPQDLSVLLRIVGLTHIIVTSGTHLGILVGFARRVFGKISRFAGLFGAGMLVILMMGIVGMTPSIVRAGTVALLSLAAWYVGRKWQAWRIILLVGALTLIYQPIYLIDLAWLLSFGSFIGVMVVGPRLVRFFYGTNKPNWIAETALSSLAAALICTPILLYFFGTVSLISLVANVLILPTIPWALGLVFATGILGWLPWVGGVLGWLSKLLLDYHLMIIRFLGEQKSFLIEIPAKQPVVFAMYIPIIGVMVLGAIKHNIKVGKGNTGHQNWAAEAINGSDDFVGQVIKRKEIADGASNQDGEQGGN